MRTFIFFITLFIFSLKALSQEWAPVGAEWYYDKTYAFSGNINYEYVYCDSIVSFHDIDCKRIND